MDDANKLQRAVETSIAAGYQLDSEAFAYLTSIAATEDVTCVISKALLEIEELENKPVFIEKWFLQKIREQPQHQNQEIRLQPPVEEPPQEEKAQPTPESTSLFQPYAKDIDAQLKRTGAHKSLQRTALQTFLSCQARWLCKRTVMNGNWEIHVPDLESTC